MITKKDFASLLEKMVLFYQNSPDILDNNQLIFEKNGCWVYNNQSFFMSWDPSDLYSAANTVLNCGEYERDVSSIVVALSSVTSHFLDVGANNGYYSLLYTFQCLKRGISPYTIAFEPQPNNCQSIRENILKNNYSDYIDLRQVCVGESSNNITLFCPLNRYTACSTKNLHPEVENIEINVPQIMLDSLLNSEYLPSIDLIKVDIEGAELFLLKGSIEILRKYKPTLILELLRKWSLEFGYSPNDVINLLGKLNYLCFAISENLSQIFAITSDTIETNFLFIHKSKLSHFNALKISS